MLNDAGNSEDFTKSDGSRMKISGTMKRVALQIGSINFTLDTLYVTPEMLSFFIAGADIFHESRIYRTGISDRSRTLDLAYDQEGHATVETRVRFRRNAP